MPAVLHLVPNRWITLPDTNLTVLYEGGGVVTVRRRGEFWDLSPLVDRPGGGLAWARIIRDGAPATPPWPITQRVVQRVPRSGVRCPPGPAKVAGRIGAVSAPRLGAALSE